MRRYVLLALVFWASIGCSVQQGNSVRVQENYKLHSIVLADGTWTLVRLNVETGETRYAKSRSWIAIKEQEAIPFSTYRIELIAMEKQGWNLARIDAISGRVWYVKESEWIEMME
jgi:hypothetical protein